MGAARGSDKDLRTTAEGACDDFDELERGGRSTGLGGPPAVVAAQLAMTSYGADRGPIRTGATGPTTSVPHTRSPLATSWSSEPTATLT
jgi:hypothetical protein